MNSCTRQKNKRGQAMVEYIIIVVLVAIALLAIFGKFSKGVGRKVSGATSAIDEDAGAEAQKLADEDPAEKIKTLDADGSFK
ncbi:MAG: hypothetical protein ILM98_03635 [Kiritimatiellae bacterium]|jgi:Flp pilus assembly pilin Flp|nr:hypothetical protein [Kiritimatiellia bacterium]MBR4612943.1 hypothetical protein [Kiritimatiellia bacterium]